MTWAIAGLAIDSGLSPNDLADTDPWMLSTIEAQLEQRAWWARENAKKAARKSSRKRR